MPRILVSYSHDNPEHRTAVRKFTDCLRAHGFDAWIDQFAVDPDEGWPRWMQRELDKADFVLVVPTAIYLRRWKGEEAPDKGHGAAWEGLILTNRLYMAHGKAEGIRCVLVGEASVEYIPEPLQGHSWYRPSDDCERLDRYLRGLPVTAEAAPLAPLPPLPPLWSVPNPAKWDRRKPLTDFLVRTFDNLALDRILTYIPSGANLRADMPSTNVSRNEYVTRLLDVLVQGDTLIKAELWDVLRSERPNRHLEIQCLELMWR